MSVFRHCVTNGIGCRRRVRPLAAAFLWACLALPLAGLFAESVQAQAGGRFVEIPQAHDGSSTFKFHINFNHPRASTPTDITFTNAVLSVETVGHSRHYYRLVVTPSDDSAVRISVPDIGTRTVHGPAGDARLKDMSVTDTTGQRSVLTPGGNKFNPEILKYRVEDQESVDVVPFNSNATIQVFGMQGRFKVENRGNGGKHVRVTPNDNFASSSVAIRVTSEDGTQVRGYHVTFGSRDQYRHEFRDCTFDMFESVTVTPAWGTFESIEERGCRVLVATVRGGENYIEDHKIRGDVMTVAAEVAAEKYPGAKVFMNWWDMYAQKQFSKELPAEAELRLSQSELGPNPNVLNLQVRLPYGTLRRSSVSKTSDDKEFEFRNLILQVVRKPGGPGDTRPRSSQAPLTGQVQDAPTSHDGSTAFSFRILFSEDVDIGPDELRDDVIKVSHATVSAAARVDGRSDLWELTLTPKATQAISIQLRGQLECTQDGAICTADGKKLAANVTHSVAYAAPGTRSTPDPSTLTASFENVPASHGGTGTFTVELAFSEAVFDGTESFNRNGRIADAVSVTNGTLTGRRRVDPQEYDRWRLWIRPSGNGDVTVTLPETTSCSATNAICTPGGTALSGGATATIEGPGATETPQPATLTAAFENAPSSHDGSSTFSIELAFSAAVFDGTESFDKNGRIAGAVSVTNGTLTGRRRVDPQQYDRWKLRIRPSGNGNVTVSLPPTTGGCDASGAICTPGGTPLSGNTTATIQGPATLSIADATVEEGPGAELAFVITLSRALSQAVTVGFATSDGSATAGADYTAKSETVTLAAGTTSKTVKVAVLDDDHDEDSEAMSVTLSNASGAIIADGTATGTINNDDLMPQAWLARFGRTAAGHVVDAVEGRLSAQRAAGVAATLAGRPLFAGAGPKRREAEAGLETLAMWMHGEGTEDGAEPGSRPVSARELLAGTSFALTAGSAGDGFGALWGHGAASRFDGRDGGLSLHGEVESATLGAEYARGAVVAGVALSLSRGTGGYSSETGGGGIESTLTGLYPYGRYEAGGRLSLWAVAGRGTGTMTLTPEGQAPLEADLGLTMASAGARGVLMKAPSGLEVAMTSDALAARTTSGEVDGSAGRLAASEADVTRLRLGLEGTWRGLGTADGATFQPTLEIGLRHDGGDAETGFGAEVGARLAWANPSLGMTAELAARGLFDHENGAFRERGLSGSFTWDPDPASDRGATLSMRQAVGAPATGGVNALLGPEAALLPGAAGEDGATDRRRLEARLGYGMSMFGGRWTGTPELGLDVTETEREYALGWRLAERRRKGLVFGLDVEGARREGAEAGAEPGHRLGLGFGWRLEGARREDLELRVDALRDDAAGGGAPANSVGLSINARW